MNPRTQPIGSGHECPHEDTFIFTRNGMDRLKELQVRNSSYPGFLAKPTTNPQRLRNDHMLVLSSIISCKLAHMGQKVKDGLSESAVECVYSEFLREWL